MNNYIIYEPASKIREIARQALKGKWVQMFWGVLIFYALSSFVPSLLNQLFSITKYITIANHYLQLSVSYAGTLYIYLVMGSLTCGFAMFMLSFFRNHTVQYSLNLEGFSMFGKALWLYFLYTIRIALWSMLFVIPGIVAVFRYSQCFFIRVDNPDLTGSQCLRESTRLMKGNKGKLFGLYFSFFGWALLAVIPQTVFLNASSLGDFTTFIIGELLWIPVVLLQLYLETASVAFYEILTGNLVVVNPQGIPYSQSSPDNETWEDVKQKKDWDDRQ